MLQELDREEAWYIIEQIGKFDLGMTRAWEWWFKNVWRRLEASKWFEEICVRDSPVYATQQRITLFALRWIAEDFIEVLDGLSEPDWVDWIFRLQLDADKLLDVVRGHEKWPRIEADIREELGEPDIFEDLGEDADARMIHETELYSQLLPQAACFAAALHRQRLVPWLRKLFPRTEHLFQSLWCVARCGDAVWCDDEHDEASAGTDEGWPFDYHSDPDLSPDLALQLNTLAMAVFTDCLEFDADSAERMNAWEWVAGGCRIRIQGSPQYFGPGLD